MLGLMHGLYTQARNNLGFYARQDWYIGSMTKPCTCATCCEVSHLRSQVKLRMSTFRQQYVATLERVWDDHDAALQKLPIFSGVYDLGKIPPGIVDVSLTNGGEKSDARRSRRESVPVRSRLGERYSKALSESILATADKPRRLVGMIPELAAGYGPNLLRDPVARKAAIDAVVAQPWPRENEYRKAFEQCFPKAEPPLDPADYEFLP